SVLDLWRKRHPSHYLVAPPDYHLRDRADRRGLPARGVQLVLVRACSAHGLGDFLSALLGRMLRGSIYPLRPSAGTTQLLRVFHLERLCPANGQFSLSPAGAAGAAIERGRNSCHGGWRQERSPDARVPRLVVSGGGGF